MSAVNECEAAGALAVKDGHIVLLRDGGDLDKDDQRAMDILTGVYLMLSNPNFQNSMVQLTKKHRSEKN